MGRITVVSLVSIVVIGLLVYLWWPSEERAIKRRLNELAEIVSLPETEPELGRVTRVAGVRGYLADDLRIQTGSQEVSRDAVLAVVGRFTPPPGGILVDFVDTQVTLAPDSTTADVYLTVKITTRDSRTGEPTLDAREATVGMAKRRGEWVVTSAATLETLRRP